VNELGNTVLEKALMKLMMEVILGFNMEPKYHKAIHIAESNYYALCFVT